MMLRNQVQKIPCGIAFLISLSIFIGHKLVKRKICCLEILHREIAEYFV